MASDSKGIALVTGAGQGIGHAIAVRLAADGFDVAVNDISSKEDNLGELVKKIQGQGRRSCQIIADVSEEDQVKGMIESVVNELGGLDVMVANAGIIKYAVSVLETTAEDWDRTFSVNAKGTFFCYKYAGLQMVAQGRGGRIIGASSVAGKRGIPFGGAYSSSKFAVRGLTQSTALELGKYGITVNAYAPGAIDTPMLQGMDDMMAERQGAEPGAFYKRTDTMSPLGYKGTPLEISSLVSYLASKEAHFITGQSMSCNGGTFFD